MFLDSQYQLIDFGNGKKIESFSEVLVSRETPSVGFNRSLRFGQSTQLSYSQQGKQKGWVGAPPPEWVLKFGDTEIKFHLRPTPTGQVGVFPEQAKNWSWILQHADHFTGKRALNLFGYTGGTTMALAVAGAEVTHVDAASSVVRWASENAQLSGLQKASIRWIVEDAKRFVARELKRGNRYDIIIADPPSFGRGPKGETWKLTRDFPGFLTDLADLMSDTPAGVILSCHTPGITPKDLRQFARCFGSWGTSDAFSMKLVCKEQNGGRESLASGCCFRIKRT